jgi:hypothetical protein
MTLGSITAIPLPTKFCGASATLSVISDILIPLILYGIEKTGLN